MSILIVGGSGRGMTRVMFLAGANKSEDQLPRNSREFVNLLRQCQSYRTEAIAVPEEAADEVNEQRKAQRG